MSLRSPDITIDLIYLPSLRVGMLLLHPRFVEVLIAAYVHEVQLIHQAARLQHFERAIHRNPVQLGVFLFGELIKRLRIEVFAGAVQQIEQDPALAREPHSAFPERILNPGGWHHYFEGSKSRVTADFKVVCSEHTTVNEFGGACFLREPLQSTRMTKRFHLYWLKESGCDLGTPVDADELDAAIRSRVVELAAGDDRPLTLHLPFLDGRESRRRAEALRGATLVREGDVIRSVPSTPSARLRNHAAMLLATHPAWMNAPDELQPRYFQTWQEVSLALQMALRSWIPEIYFRDPARYEDRDAAFPLLVYAASRPCRGRPRTEFTYDVVDSEVLPCALNLIGTSLQNVLRKVETHLHQCGRPELARRYSPLWHQDVLRAVQKRPRQFVGLLGDEAAVVSAVIDFGNAGGMQAVKPFAKSANLALRNMYGEDLRPLAFKALEEATRTLGEIGRAVTLESAA